MPWNDETMALQPYFDSLQGYKFRLLTGARTIDLGDEKVDY